MRRIRQRLTPTFQCTEHSVDDVFPCPWPNCVNGCQENKFELVKSDDQTEIHTRIEWRALNGDSYYSWKGSVLPNWFGIDKTLSREARRLGIFQLQDPKTIYHYTNLEGLKGIIENNSLWLSDYSYLNDSSEISHGADLIDKVINELLKTEKDENTKSVLEAWIEGVKNINKRICIASFSTDGDNLSQWRAYGSVAIGFKSGYPIGFSRMTYFQPIIYNESDQEQLVKLYINHMVQAHALDYKSGDLERIEDVYHKTEHLLRLIAFFKDGGFKDEVEYRIAYMENAEICERFGFKIAPQRYRISEGKFIPYMESTDIQISSEEKDKLSIRSVILGPGSSDLLKCGIRELLNYNGYEDVVVEDSDLPYRTNS